MSGFQVSNYRWSSFQKIGFGIGKLVFGLTISALFATEIGLQPATAAEQVTIYGPWSGLEASAFQQELDLQFPGSAGIKVKYTSLTNYDTSIGAVMKSDARPNIVLWNEPESLIANAGRLVPLTSVLGVAGLKKAQATLPFGWNQVAAANQELLGLPIAATPRDLVFTNPSTLKALGLKVPQNDGELQSLQSAVVSGGEAYPWCLGLEAGAATGYPADAWLKAYVLRLGGVGKYNAWLHGTLAWGRGVVSAAGNRMAQNLLAPGALLGGGAGASVRNFGSLTSAGLYASDKASGRCLFQLGSINTLAGFPAVTQKSLAAGKLDSVKVFQLPTPVGGTPATLVGGVLASVAMASPGTAKVLKYLVGDKFGSRLMARQGLIFNPHYNFPVATYPGALRQAVAAILYSSKSVGFDEVVRAPAKVSPVIWQNLTAWFSGKVAMTKAFNEIDAFYRG